jgi:iron(III) transport system ATP-binding protein
MLKLANITKTIGDAALVQDICMDAAAGERVALFGPSGSGKTTLLRLIAGLDTANSGTIHINGAVASEPAIKIKPALRRVGMVFQDLALWPHLNVANHLRLMMPRDARDVEPRVTALLESVDLASRNHRKPHELSGGEKQRLALARALAGSPRILLLDEPFSNLQLTLKKELIAKLRQLSQAEAITLIYVTHAPEDLPEFAHRVVMMDRGTAKASLSIEAFSKQFGLSGCAPPLPRSA